MRRKIYDLKINIPRLFSFSNQSSFGGSIAAWEEMTTMASSQHVKLTHMNEANDNGSDDMLSLKTREVIMSFDVIQKLAKIPLYSAYLLKNTPHLKALSTALLMARSHHALGVEEAFAEEESTATEREIVNKFRVAIHHHLCALKLISEVQRLRAVPSISLGGNECTISSVGASNMNTLREQRLTVCARDLDVVSCH